MIRDRIVVGIKDTALSQKLQLESDLTLEKAMITVRQREMVIKQQLDLRKRDDTIEVDLTEGNRKNMCSQQDQRVSQLPY